MAFQQNQVPQGHVHSHGSNPPNPTMRHPSPGNQWKGGPPVSSMAQPSFGVNGFSGAGGMAPSNHIHTSPESTMSGQNFMNGPSNVQFDQNFGPGIPQGSVQNRMQGPPAQFGGPRPPVSNPGLNVSNPGQTMPGPPPRMGPPRMPTASLGQTGVHQQKISQGPPSERTSRDNSPAIPNTAEGSPYDALEGQWHPDMAQGRQGHQGQHSMATSLTNSQATGFVPMSSMSQVPGYPPSSQSMAPRSSQQPVQGLQAPTTSTGARPGFPPPSGPGQRPGFPPQTSVANQQPGYRPPSAQQVNQTPPSGLTNIQPRFPPPPSSLANQQPGFPPPPTSTSQHPQFPPGPNSGVQRPGFPPPSTTTANQHAGFPPQPVPNNQYPGFPPPSTSSAQLQSRLGPPPNSQFQPFPNNQPQPTIAPQGPQGEVQQKTGISEFVNHYPKPNAGMNSLASNFGNMAVQGPTVWNLMQQKRLISPEGVETPKPVIPNDFKNVNCSPEVFRCTLNAIPQTSALLNKARLPLGILIHPFKDLSQLPVIQSSVIVRCRSCRTYINPFVYFLDSRRWKCNLCYRANELPDEFSFDPVSKTYGDPQRRPEIKSATIEFIAPSEYMLRPPQPAVYLYLLDVSFNAIETGYLRIFCKTLLEVLDKIPGDSRTQIGFIAYDSAVHFFNLAEGLSQPQMLTVTDVEDIFLPCPDDLLVNLNESRNLVEDLLNQLPSMFEGNMETRSALGAALQAACKMISGPGGRVSVLQTILPSIGPGALQNREDTGQKGGKDIPNLGPATDFYKKMALDCSAQQVAVDLFMFNGQYADISSIECISKFSGGVVQYYSSYHSVRTPHLVKKFEVDLRRYLTRKIGLEAVMRIRCSKGMSIHTFHGNFFVRSTDLLSLPNINPDAGFGMQMSIEEPLTDMSTMCFQAALLYTSSKGERRIRVHTLCLPITNQISEVYAAADQQAIVALMAKMAVDRSMTSSMSDAREAIVNATVDVLNSYGSTLTSSQRSGSISINDQLRLMPLYCLALLKSPGFRIGVPMKLDDRVFAMQEYKTLPVASLILRIYPNLYPLHTIMDVETVKKGNLEYPKLPVLQLSSANVDRNGAYFLDTGSIIYLYIGSAINSQFCQDILNKPNFAAIEEGGIGEFPELENEGSERFQDFITFLLDSRPDGASFVVVREDGRLRMQFFQHFVEDRTESTMSYYEYLQHIQKQLKS